jgi:hypothetical protein
MGTPEYMSPEQAAGRPADARCDVYALGAIMYEMVTGIPPYSGDNFMEILTKKATQDPLPPSVQRFELPSQVSDLVMAAMARSPSDRPQTMEALEYELNKCLAGRGVAVAQILGMTTDPHVVATLNPGLSIRQLDDAAVVARPQTSSPAIGLPRPGSHSGMTELPASFSGPTMATGQNPLMVRAITEPSTVPSAGQSMPLRAQSSPSMLGPAASDPNLMLSQPNIVLRRSAAGVFGWLVLAAMLFGGVGALLYIALGERNAASRAASASAAAAGSNSPVKVNVVLPPPEGGSDRAQLGSAVGSTSVPMVPEPDAVTGSGPLVDNLRPDPGAGGVRKPADDRGTRKAPRIATVKRTPPAADEAVPKNFAVLVKQAKAHEKAGQWSDARAIYQRLEKVKGYAGEAYYRQAWNAFQSNAIDDAIQLAAEAVRQPGSFKTPALVLYGDLLYRQKEFDRAKTIYAGVRKSVTGEERAAITRKIARCNEWLKLPERHGVVD